MSHRPPFGNAIRYRVDFGKSSRGEQPQPAQATPCEKQGQDHQWGVTSLQGYFMCQNCNMMGHCPVCVPKPPIGAATIYCEQHKDTRSE